MEMPVSELKRLAPQTGCAFSMRMDDELEIISPLDEQVADLACFARMNFREYFSAGRTLDYNENVFLTTGSTLYSNQSRQMMRIEHDDAGRHDYLLTPCSLEMFRILRGMDRHPSCLENLAAALCSYGVPTDGIHSTFNAFMHVEMAANGRISIMPPSSKAGNRIVLRALTDLIVGLTACSSEHSNAGICKAIDYIVHPAATI
jgi:uncharacterized protein YcgI (DUF1989 family)